MISEEIEILKETVEVDSKEEINNTLEEDSLYVLSESEGWRIMMKKFHRRIANLLEPIQHQDITVAGSLELIGAMAIARREKIDALTEFVNEVESIRKARRQMLKQQEDSKKKA